MAHTNFELVRDLNLIAGNPPTGNWSDLVNQAKYIRLEWEEFCENADSCDHDKLRDDCTDLLVTIYGLMFRMGVNADTDMRAVMDALYTRFDRTPEDAELTKAKYAAWGVECYTHVDSTTVPGQTYYVTKSAKDQTGLNAKGKEEFYPKDKFLKSINTRTEVFEPIPVVYKAALEMSAQENQFRFGEMS